MPKLPKSKYDEQSEEIVKTIKKAMIDRNMNQKGLAKKLNKWQGTISKWLKNIDSIPFGELRQMAEKLGLKIKIGE